MDVDVDKLHKEIENKLARWVMAQEEYTEESGWYSLTKLSDLAHKSAYHTELRLNRGIEKGIVEFHQDGRKKYYRMIKKG